MTSCSGLNPTLNDVHFITLSYLWSEDLRLFYRKKGRFISTNKARYTFKQFDSPIGLYPVLRIIKGENKPDLSLLCVLLGFRAYSLITIELSINHK